jgi:filamentous hemagglutinin family protein
MKHYAQVAQKWVIASPSSANRERSVLNWRCCETALAGLHVLGYTLLLTHLTLVPYAYAAPSGGTIVGGNGAIHQSGSTTDITQHSASLAINWSSFDVDSNEVVNFIQPNASSIALNRILGNNASQIFGKVNADGHVILVNPNGIFFGESASLNVGGLVASGLDISPDEFMEGNYLFTEVLGTQGTVINAGLINAATGGNVGLLGKQVKNEGMIVANLGAVNLAAGKEAVLTFDNEGLIGIRVTKAVLQDELGIDAAVINGGDIVAPGGRILLTASQSQDIFSQAVNTGDLQQATSVVVNDDGSFTLGSGADVVNSGVLDVSSTELDADGGRVAILGENVTSSGTIKADARRGDGGDIELHAADTALLTDDSVTRARSEYAGEGGIVKVLGNKVGVFDHSVIDVSGANGGGQALIGGDYQGKNRFIRNASRSYVGRTAQISADALQSGDGGKSVTWGDEYTWFFGNASARGGSVSGNGGFVEISGEGMSFDGAIDTTAANGRAGVVLFDPENIEILAGDGSGDDVELSDLNDSDGAQVLFADGEQGSGTFYITQETLENITGTTSISLEAKNDIILHDLSSGAGAGTLDLRTSSDYFVEIAADSDRSGNGSFTMLDPNDTIKTNGGSIYITAASITAGNIITSGGYQQAGGSVTLKATSGDLEVGEIAAEGRKVGDGESGLDGGSIHLESAIGNVHVGNVNSSGSAGNGWMNSNEDGGNAGTIQIKSAGAITAGTLTAEGGSRDNSGKDGDGGSITIGGIGTLRSPSGAVEVGSILTTGAAVTIDGTSVTANNITTTGKVDQAGGTISVEAHNGDLKVGDIESMGGTATAEGQQGGGVTLVSSANITVDGGISTDGSDGDTGGNAGAIAVTATNGKTSIGGDVTAVGGSGSSGADGAGGDITFEAQQLEFASGLSDMTFEAGKGAAVSLTGEIDYGNLASDSTLAIRAGDSVTVNGGISADNQKITNVTLEADKDGDGTGVAKVAGAMTTYGGNVTIEGASVEVGNVTTKGGKNTQGGAIDIEAHHGSLTMGQIDSQGGKAETNGMKGGAIDLVAATHITVNGTINTNGSDGAAGISTKGGAAGSVALTATDGDITLGGNITAKGGKGGTDADTAVIGVTGNGGDITLDGQHLLFASNLNSLVIDAGIGAGISVTGDIDYQNAVDGSLNIQAGDEIALDGGISAEGLLSVELTGNTDGDADGNVGVSAITTNGGAVTISGTSIATGNIDTTGDAGRTGGDVSLTSTSGSKGGITSGNITAKGGVAGLENDGLKGGSVTLLSTSGNISTGDIDSSGSVANASTMASTGGQAGIIKVTANSGDLAVGDVFANGGDGAEGGVDGNAAAIELSASSGTMTLKGDLSAVGNSDADVTVSADTVQIDGDDAQRIEGDSVKVISSTLLALKQSLTVNAQTSAELTGDVDYDGIGVGQLTLQAGNGVTLTGGILDGVPNTADQLAVTLTGNHDGGTGGVTTGGNVTTGGGAFTVAGVSYSDTGGTPNITTSGGDVSIEAASVTLGNVDTHGATGRAGGAVSLTSNGAHFGGITVGAINSSGGTAGASDEGTTGGDVTLSSVSGNITVNGPITSNGGDAGSDANDGGTAGAISLTADVGSVTVGGDILAEGGDADVGVQGDGGAITLNAHSETLSLQGNLGAQGENAGDISIDARTLDATDLESIAGDTIDITLGTAFALQQSLAITAAADANINADFNYDGRGTGDLAVTAGRSIRLNGSVSDGAPGTADQLSITLMGGNSVTDQVAVKGDITTGGADFSISGANYDESAYSVDTGLGKAVIDVVGNAALGRMNVGGNLEVSATGTITQTDDLSVGGAASFSGNTLYLEGALSVSNPVVTDVNSLNLNNVSSALVFEEADDITLIGENSLSGTGALTLHANGAIREAAGASLTSANDLTLRAGGDIVLGGANQLSGSLDLDATGHDITLSNATDTFFTNLAARKLTIHSQGAVSHSETATVAIETLHVGEASSLKLDNGTNALTIERIQSVGDVDIDAGDVHLTGRVTTQGRADLKSDKGVTGDAGSVISASKITLDAGTGIGTAGDALRTSTSSLDVETDAGVINMVNTGSVTLEMLKTGAGDIIFTNDKDIAIDRVETDLVSGKVVLTTSDGDMTGVGPTPAHTQAEADVVGNSASFFTMPGNFGTVSRPIVVYAPHDITLVSMISFDPVFLPSSRTGTVADFSPLRFSAFDILTGLAGEQVTQVENLETLDPAIFTEVHNYNLSDISILMPSDQRYDEP